MKPHRWTVAVLLTLLSMSLLSSPLAHAAPPTQDDEYTPLDIEALAQRVHLHNSRSGDVTMWAGGILGTAVELAPRWPLGEPLEGWVFPGLGDDQPDIALEDFERPILINVWASWCGPCIHEFPLLAEIAVNPYAHAYDVVFVDTWEPADEGLRFLADQPAGLCVGADPGGLLLSTIGSAAIPTSILLDAEQRVLAIHLGNYTAVQAALFELIAADPGGYEGTFDPAELDPPAQLVPHIPVRLNAAEELRLGAATIGRIVPGTGQEAYRFTGQAGDMINARMDAEEVRPHTHTLEPYVILLDAEGNFLAESADYLYEPYAEIRDFMLPEDGDYIVIATRYMGAYGYSIGGYTLRVERK